MQTVSSFFSFKLVQNNKQGIVMLEESSADH